MGESELCIDYDVSNFFSTIENGLFRAFRIRYFFQKSKTGWILGWLREKRFYHVQMNLTLNIKFEENAENYLKRGLKSAFFLLPPDP